VKCRPGDNLMIHKALTMAQPGDVIVVDAGGDLTNSLFGEIMVATAVKRGVAGVVLNGAVRDSEEIGRGTFPLYAAGVTHRGPYKDGPGEINVPIAIDGMVIHPGDLILGDADGLLCVPYRQRRGSAGRTRKKMEAEKKTLADIAGRPLDTSWIDATLKRIGCNPEPADDDGQQARGPLGPVDRPCLRRAPGARAGVSLGVFPVRGNPPRRGTCSRRARVPRVRGQGRTAARSGSSRAELLARCPDLLCVSSSGAGYDTVDVAACTAAGVAVVNQAGGNAASVAEHTLGLMLGVSRRMIEGDRRMRRETGYSREDVMGHEIRGKTLGLVGIGHIGTARRGPGQGLRLDVIATDPLLSPEEIAPRRAPVTFDELLAQSDFVSLHCPRDASTLKMMNADAFAA
jgi:regulator of RNase E activity RraA